MFFFHRIEIDTKQVCSFRSLSYWKRSIWLLFKCSCFSSLSLSFFFFVVIVKLQNLLNWNQSGKHSVYAMMIFQTIKSVFINNYIEKWANESLCLRVKWTILSPYRYNNYFHQVNLNPKWNCCCFFFIFSCFFFSLMKSWLYHRINIQDTIQRSIN